MGGCVCVGYCCVGVGCLCWLVGFAVVVCDVCLFIVIACLISCVYGCFFAGLLCLRYPDGVGGDCLGLGGNAVLCG